MTLKVGQLMAVKAWCMQHVGGQETAHMKNSVLGAETGTTAVSSPWRQVFCLSAPVCQGMTAGVFQILKCEFLELLILGNFDSYSNVGFEQRWAGFYC